MCGIYKIINKINNKIYVGQSVNIQKRWYQHLYDANHRPTIGIDQAIKKYGAENFQCEPIEECSADELNDKEIYWIEKLNTFKGEGYNNSIGGLSLQGENHPRAFLTDEQVWDIREMYKNHCKFQEVKNKYLSTGISERGLQKIWRNEIDKIYLDYTQNHMSIRELSKKYNRDYGVIEKYINNPKEVSQVKYKGRKIQNVETKKIFSSISSAAKWASCGATTITRHLYDNKPAGKVPNTLEDAHWIEI